MAKTEKQTTASSAPAGTLQMTAGARPFVPTFTSPEARRTSQGSIFAGGMHQSLQPPELRYTPGPATAFFAWLRSLALLGLGQSSL